MRWIRQSSKNLRFAASLLALCAALLIGSELAHDHSSLDSPDVCATCRVTAHSPAAVTTAPIVAAAPEPELAVVSRIEHRPSSIARPTLHSRAPPLSL